MSAKVQGTEIGEVTAGKKVHILLRRNPDSKVPETGEIIVRRDVMVEPMGIFLNKKGFGKAQQRKLVGVANKIWEKIFCEIRCGVQAIQGICAV